MRSVLIFVLIASFVSGCYVGRTPTAKRVNYVLNGALVVTGVVAMAAASSDGGSCSGDASCVGGGLAAGGGATLGLALLAAGAVGIGVSAIVPTKYPAPDAEDDGVIHVGRPTRAMHSKLFVPAELPAHLQLPSR